MRQSGDQSKVPGLAELLWEALLRVEAAESHKPDDPFFLEFKHNVLRTIAELEIMKTLNTIDEDESKSA